MELKEAILHLEQKFISGNDVSIEQATITREEWDVIYNELCSR